MIDKTSLTFISLSLHLNIKEPLGFRIRIHSSKPFFIISCQLSGSFPYFFADIGISRWRCAYISAEIYPCNFYLWKRMPLAYFAFP